MKPFVQLPFLFILFLCNHVFAEQTIVAGDGKQYKLKDDGTWELVSNDRLLDTDDGKRVILKADGSWQYVGLAPKEEKTEFQSLELSATIDNIRIEETRESVGGGKNTRISAKLISSLKLALADTAKDSVNLDKLNVKSFLITDNRDKKYPVTTIEPSVTNLKPGQNATLVLTSNKAPKRMRGVAELNLRIDTGTLGNEKAITLSHDFARVKRKTEVK